MRIQSRVEIKRMFMIFFLALTLILFIQHPLLVHAAGGSMTATDVAGGSLNDVGGGPTYVHSGYIFYLVDTKGNEVTGVRAMTSYSWMPIQDSKGNEISKSNVAMVSRKGTEASGNVVMGAPFPCGSPFGSDGSGNGDEIKAWLLAKAENGHTNAANFIRKMFSTYHAEKWEKKEVYLVYEVVGWNHLYKDKKSTGIWFCGTTSRFGIVQNALNINADGKGDSTINRYTNNIYPNCMKLEDCKEIRAMGYKAPTHSGIVSNKEMGTRAEVFSGTCNNGWGIGVVWNEESKVIHTYDSINSPGEPEKAEGDKKGTSNIVKCYYTEKKENGVVKELINDGTFTREQCTNKISIDNEPEYQIEKWVVSSTYDSTVQSTLDGKTVSFDVPASIQETGTSAEVKTLSDPKSTVYVLLKHSTNQVVKPVVTGANYEISESSITRRIWFATPDSQGSMPQIALEHTRHHVMDIIVVDVHVLDMQEVMIPVVHQIAQMTIHIIVV